jgi:predicted dehydrogenase
VHLHTQYDYGDGRAIIAEGSWAAAPSFGFQMSFNIMLEKATLVYDCTRQPAFRVCPAEGEAFSPQVADGDGYAREIAYFVALIQGKNPDVVLTPNQSKESVRIVQAERRSALEGKKIQIENM